MNQVSDHVVYFDNAASTRPDGKALALAQKTALAYYANPGSIHDLGIGSDAYLEKARRQIVSLMAPRDLPDNPFTCVFTSGATEGNNIAILGAACAQKSYARQLITTTAEHASVARVFDRLESEGFTVRRIAVGSDGALDWDAYRVALATPVGLVSALAVSNQNGAILPVAQMAAVAKEVQPRTLFHTDATQAVGKLVLDLAAVDFVTFSGHKIGGLRGSGALLKRRKARLVPPEVGGGQEDGLRSGTPNLPGDVALAYALRVALATLPERTARATALNDRIRAGLASLGDAVFVASPLGQTIPFVLTIGLRWQRASVMDQYLSSRGVYVSTTSACDDKHDGPNAVLRAMGLAPHLADNPIRLSFTGLEPLEDADIFLEAFKDGIKNLRHDI